MPCHAVCGGTLSKGIFRVPFQGKEKIKPLEGLIHACHPLPCSASWWVQHKARLQRVIDQAGLRFSRGFGSIKHPEGVGGGWVTLLGVG